jgi:hypothetical protein
MNLTIGGNSFISVKIPLLWGSKAVLQDDKSRISVIDLSGPEAKVEILGDKPAPEIEYIPTASGFQILSGGLPQYSYNPQEKVLMSLSKEALPNCKILRDGVIVGTNQFRGNMVIGFEVGIVVDKNGVGMGARLPEKLAKLKV